MEIDDARLVDAAVELVEVIGELHSVVLDDIGGTAHRSGGEVAMLRHLVAGTGDDEARGGGNVERVLAVAARSHHVDVAVAVEHGRHTRGKYSVTETQQFVYRHASHLQASEQGCNLLLGELALSDSHDDVFRFLTRKFLVVQHSVQDVFHFHHKSLLYF